MPERPLFPDVSLVIGAGKAALLKARPSAADHISEGHYALPFIGWRGQFALARVELVRQAKRPRLKQSEGLGLRELGRDHYDLELEAGPSHAVGEAILVRKVVHVCRQEPIDVPDARDEPTVVTLIEALIARLGEHLASVFDSVAGAGAHLAGDDHSITLAGIEMAELCACANELKQACNRHVQNRHVKTGWLAALHHDPDEEHKVEEQDASPSGPGGFEAQSPVARQKLLLLVNAVKRTLEGHVALEARGGSIRAGTAFSVQGDRRQLPPVEAAEYVAVRDIYARPGSAQVTLAVVAIQPGPHANLPQWVGGARKRVISIRGPLFDDGARHAFQLVELRAAGGAVDHLDAAIRKAARANWIGRHGPVSGALVAGCLEVPGPRNVVVREDLERGRAVVYVADQHWAYSDRWHEMLLLRLRQHRRIGFGCRVVFAPVLNRLVRVEITVKLRDSAHLAASAAITERLRGVLTSYFDDRPDFWVWDIGTLRALCTRADSRILACPHAVVRDEQGRPLAAPTEPKPGEPLIHGWFAADALDVSFLPPA